MIVGWSPQTGHARLRGTFTTVKLMASAFQISSRPRSGSPTPRIAFTTSVACSVPTTPGTTPRTPTSWQEGTMPAGGGVGKRQR